MNVREELSRRLPATRHRDFRALWGGTASSSISLWTLLLGNAWVVYDLSESSLWVGVSTFASMSPYFLAPLGGTVADRLPRRVLVRSTRLSALAVAAFPCPRRPLLLRAHPVRTAASSPAFEAVEPATESAHVASSSVR